MAATLLEVDKDATQSFTSKSIRRERSYDWSLIMLPVGLDADYRITLEVSDDDVNYSDFKLVDQLIDYTENFTIFDSILIGTYFRFKYDPNGNSTGTISASFNIKNR